MLPIKAVDFERRLLNYPRPKTGVIRKIPLWPESVQAIREAFERRPEPKNPEDSHLLFIGRRGESYVGNHRGYRVTQEFKRVCKHAGVSNRTFHDLRRTFQATAEDSHDFAAVQSIMGHAAPENDMSSRYRQRVSDERLQAVVGTVRAWLFDARPAEGDETAEDEAPSVIRFGQIPDPLRASIEPCTSTEKLTELHRQALLGISLDELPSQI